MHVLLRKLFVGGIEFIFTKLPWVSQVLYTRRTAEGLFGYQFPKIRFEPKHRLMVLAGRERSFQKANLQLEFLVEESVQKIREENSKR